MIMEPISLLMIHILILYLYLEEMVVLLIFLEMIQETTLIPLHRIPSVHLP